jgi:hypothetical protein
MFSSIHTDYEKLDTPSEGANLIYDIYLYGARGMPFLSEQFEKESMLHKL